MSERADALPYTEYGVRTHYEGCYRTPGHHNCAVREVERLKQTLDQPSIYTGAYKGEVVELRLCEYERSFLRPGVLYRFTPGDDCERCQELAEMYEDEPGTPNLEKRADGVLCCNLCGSHVRVVSSDEGTSFYRVVEGEDREVVVDEDVVDDLRVALVRAGIVENTDGWNGQRAPEEMGVALLDQLRKAGYIGDPATWIKRRPNKSEERDDERA